MSRMPQHLSGVLNTFLGEPVEILYNLHLGKQAESEGSVLCVFKAFFDNHNVDKLLKMVLKYDFMLDYMFQQAKGFLDLYRWVACAGEQIIQKYINLLSISSMIEFNGPGVSCKCKKPSWIAFGKNKIACEECEVILGKQEFMRQSGQKFTNRYDYYFIECIKSILSEIVITGVSYNFLLISDGSSCVRYST